jgi:mRNA-degrading endonuclease RelE of RelBE toxin-antitoxin system
MFTIDWTKEAVRRLGRLDKAVAEAVLKRVSMLAASPDRYGKRLRNLDVWSLRVGGHRVLYVIDFPSNRVVIVTIGPRRSVYDRE